MGDGRSTGAGLVLCLTILGFAVCLLFALWPLAFLILFLGLVTFCALESSRKGTVSRTPQDTRPRRYEVRTPPTPTTEEYRPPYFREAPEKPRVRVPVKYGEDVTTYERAAEKASELETGDLSRKGIYRWEDTEKTETPTLVSEAALRGEPPYYRRAEEKSDIDELKEELESTKTKYRSISYGAEVAEKAKKEATITPPAPEKSQELKDLESQEEANRILLEELKKRWMSGKIDVAMYNKLKEKYEKKIAEIEKQKKKLAKNGSTQTSTK